MKETLITKFQERNARIAVIGLGYVGLPLAVNFAQAGYRVTGIDLDRRKVDAVNRGESYIGDISSTQLATVTQLHTTAGSPHAIGNGSTTAAQSVALATVESTATSTRRGFLDATTNLRGAG